jgi:Acetyltransferase (GNAT) domain
MSLLPDHDEHLTDGWEAGLAPADSLIRQAVLVHCSFAVNAARRIGRPWLEDDDVAAGYTIERGQLGNWVVLKRPSVDHAAVVDRLSRLFAPSAPYLMVSAWPSPDLRPLGLGLVGHPPLMLRPPGPPLDQRWTACTLRWVVGGQGVVDAERVLVEGYPLPELQPLQPGSALDSRLLADDTRLVVAYDGDEPVATAAAHSACGVTLVENVATLPAARGKGAGTAVTAAATTAFAGQPAVLIASDAGQPIYQRLGYLRVERWTAWLRPPG